MKLEAWFMIAGGPNANEPGDDTGLVYWKADVDALLFEIRRLLDAERGENYTMMDYGPNRAALDALLADGVE